MTRSPVRRRCELRLNGFIPVPHLRVARPRGAKPAGVGLEPMVRWCRKRIQTPSPGRGGSERPHRLTTVGSTRTTSTRHTASSTAGTSPARPPSSPRWTGAGELHALNHCDLDAAKRRACPRCASCRPHHARRGGAHPAQFFSWWPTGLSSRLRCGIGCRACTWCQGELRARPGRDRGAGF